MSSLALRPLATALVMATTMSLAAPSLRAQRPADSTAASGTASGTARGTARVRYTVATRALQTGDTLRADDFTLVDSVIVWRWAAVAPDTTRAQIGWVTHRPIAVGEVLRAPAVSAPAAVKAGAKVSVLYQDGPVRLVLTGVATNTASLGAPVGVRIDATRRLDGIAVAPNTVRLR